MASRLRRWAQLVSAALLVLGLLLRISVRDRIDGLATVFYATPWPILAIVALVAAALWIPKKRIVVACLITGVISAITWIVGSYERNPPTMERQDLRVVSWNAEHAKSRLPDVIATARKFEADILGIAETESTEPADAESWRAAFPGYTVQTLPGFMLFITRGEQLEHVSGTLADGGSFNLVQLKFGEQRVQVLFVDFHSNPLHSRRPAFDALRAVLSKLPDGPVIVMGDFNTPRESVYFRRLQEQLHDSFDSAGIGLAETWPVPAPVLSLDHILVSKPLRILRCKHGWTSISDHRPVIADFAW